MRILMIGGTRFVGMHIVEAALAAGHEVTIFHRGRTRTDAFPDVEHRFADRDRDLSALAGGTWDATIDTCAYVPRQVRALADVLGERGGHYVYISSVSVYASPASQGFDEDAPLAELLDPDDETITDESYGGLKVRCERATRERFGASTLIVRPTYVVGPDDYTWRFPWWVTRMARGGEVLAPGPADDPAQVVDARDQATWIVGALSQRLAGAFHTVGPAESLTWGELLGAIASAVAPAGTTLTWVDESWLLAAGIDGSTLPLWAGGEPDRLLSTASPASVLATGFHHRPLTETILDTLAWTLDRECPEGQGLARDREAELLAAWHAR